MLYLQTKLINMKYKLLIIALFTNLVYSQTTYQYNWGMSSTNQQITINVGDTVTWTWGGGTHNLRSTGGTESFNSGYYTGPGPQFSYTFNTPGVTTYICDPHPNSMYGTVTVTGTASVDEVNLFDFSLFPNPVSEIINMKFENIVNGQITVEIYDVLGKLNSKSNTALINNKVSLDVSSLSKGIYIAKVYSEDGVSVRRFVKD